jgi:hypothetical protein
VTVWGALAGGFVGTLLLTTGLVAAGMQSLAAGQKRLPTPHLAVRYRAPRESTFWRS